MAKPDIRAVLFDLGNTLAAYYYADQFQAVLERGIRSVLAELDRRGIAAADFDTALAEALRLNAEAKDFRVRPLADRLVRVFGVDVAGDAGLLAAMSAQFLAPVFALGRRYDDVLPVLAHLRAAGFRIGIVSNSPWGSPAALWRAEVQRLELLDAVDVTVFCGDVGWRKPARLIFERAAALVGVPCEQCCFVGDDLKWDFEGATAAGMHAILLDRDGRHAARTSAKARDLWDVARHLTTTLRLATEADFAEMHRLRMSVRENRLRDPESVRLEDYVRILSEGGRAWVCENEGRIAGFAIADGKNSSVWALFVDPAQERRGIGRALHDMMMEWFFSSGATCVWLSTDPGTRAQRFYESAGWKISHGLPGGEVRYELRERDWVKRD